ncbi:MAG: hypothetical protein F4W92_10275 [Gammaproteobacteria bacterium]|nr:hypothetical protein [Gammaproteobacteria bacterium]
MIRIKILPSTKALVLIITGVIVGVVATLTVWILANLSSSNPVQHQSDNYNESSPSIPPHSDDTLVSKVNTNSTDQIKSAVRQIDALEQLQNHFERRATLYTLVAPLSDESIAELLTRSEDQQWNLSSKIRADLQRVLLERLSSSKPIDAIQYVLDHSQDGSGIGAMLFWLFKDWANSNLAAAVENAKKLPTAIRKIAFEGILQAYTQETNEHHPQISNDFNLDKHFVKSLLDVLDFENLTDPDLVWFAVIDIVEQDLSFAPQLEGLAKQWYLSSGFDVLEGIRTSVSHYEMKVTLFSNLLRYITKSEPARAFDYIATQLELGLRWDTAPHVISEWATQDPSTAHDAVSNIDPIALREFLRKTVIETWALKHPEYVLQNLSNFHQETRTHAVTSAIESLTSESPDVAVSWVLQLEDDIDQFDAARALVSVWSQHDLNAALNWVQSESAIAEFRHFLYQTLAISMVSTDPSGAFELALTLRLANGGVGFEAEIVSQIATEDVELALTLLPKVRNGKSKGFAYEQVGDALVRSGEFKKAANLGTQLDESYHSSYYQYISYIWVNMDPDKLYAMLPDLPNAEARSKAAYALFVLYDGNDSIPQKKVESLDQYLTEIDRETLGPLAPTKDP